VLAGAAGVAASLGGCISTSQTPPGQAAADEGGGGGSGLELLKAGGSSTVFPITQLAASYWGGGFPEQTFASTFGEVAAFGQGNPQLPETVEAMYAGHGGPFVAGETADESVQTVIARALTRAERRRPKYPDE